ncbi:uncharacterized protein LOC141853836 [Brevipalpus obovatus]|uniref:uncharacterized protein LOC141853836 n=1 Tax=Brevipalpus obovatus TaxID=246614 RepID=UPI003D9E3411
MCWRYKLLSVAQRAKIERHCAFRNARVDNEHVAKAVAFWNDKIAMRCELDMDQKPIAQVEIINKTLMRNMDLLCVDLDAMEKRFQNLDKLGFLYSRPLMRVFHEAPRGWFLQDWTEFMKKFGYFQHRIMAWFTKKEDDRWPEPHPLTLHPTIIEKPYHHLKTRMEFVKGIGMTPYDLDGGQTLNLDHAVKKLLILDNEQFLRRLAPAVRLEEYNYLEETIIEEMDQEDELLQEMVDLTDDYTAVFDIGNSFIHQARRKSRGGVSVKQKLH